MEVTLPPVEVVDERLLVAAVVGVAGLDVLLRVSTGATFFFTLWKPFLKRSFRVLA